MRKKQAVHSSPWVNHRGLIGVVVVLILAVSISTIAGVGGLKQELDQSTQAYVQDVSYQVSQRVDFQLKEITQDLKLLADSLLSLDDEALEQSYLRQKLEVLDYSDLVLMNPQGEVFSAAGKEYESWDLTAVRASLRSGRGIVALRDQLMFYAVPVEAEGISQGILVGIIEQSGMQSLLESKNLDGKMFSSIITQDGQVVISPASLEIFSKLGDIFEENPSAALAKEIEQMQENMKNQKDGIITFTTREGEQVIMSYNALDASGWTLLTIASTETLRAASDRYTAVSTAITFLSILVFIVILLMMFYIYRSHQREMEYIAYVDPVTGGRNGNSFRQRCRELLDSADPQSYSIVSLNIKDFKLINEIFGREEGDRTLHHVLQTLAQGLSDKELAARDESDHFYLCLNAWEENEIRQRVQEIVKRINSVVGRQGNGADHYHLTINLGVYQVEEPQMEVRVMQTRANIARKSIVEDSGENCAFYNTAIVQRLRMETELNNELDSSLKNEEFLIYLQPKVRLSDGKAGGAEALIRWKHPQRGMLSPAEFVPVFERNGDIRKLDFYVLQQVCMLMERWEREGIPIVPISVNLSRQQFKTPGFLSHFEEICRSYHIPERMIELELTESIVFDGGEVIKVKDVIRQIHNMGFLCSLDDFGSGYSSLGLLKEFDVDTIKLDKCFFCESSQPRAEYVVESIVELSKKLNIRTVAEGIESEEQVDFLREIQCDMIQGFIFAKPLPVKEFEEWIKVHG